ncbi:MAG: hypothetical protein ACP5KN_00305 [Armatimonadota bacterium]
MSAEQTRLYTVFMDAGVQHFESETLTPTTNDDFLRQLRERCEGVEFTPRDVSRPDTQLDAVMDELRQHQDDYDGVLVVGGMSDYGPALAGLPTVAVYNFPGFSHVPGDRPPAQCERG